MKTIKTIFLVLAVLFAVQSQAQTAVYRVTTRMVPKQVRYKVITATQAGLEVQTVKTIVYVPVQVFQRVQTRHQPQTPRRPAQPRAVPVSEQPEQEVAVARQERLSAPVGLDANGNPTPGSW